MEFIVDGDYNNNIITQIKEKEFPITHFIVYIPNSSFGSSSILLPSETDPVQATMAGTYLVEGDNSKLMACAPLLPLNAKVHEKAIR